MGSSTTSFASTHSVSLRTCSSPSQLSSPLLSQLNPTALSFPCHLQTGRGSLKSRSTSSLPFRVVCMRESRASTVTQDSWEKLILKSDAPVLVEFYASWCGPCRMVHRIMDEIAGEYAGRLKCFVLNTDTDLPVAEDYEIKAVPVVFLFKNGEKREAVVGTMPKEFYIAAIERVLGS